MEFVAGFLVTLGFIAYLFLSALINGYVLSMLWAWFMVPLFRLPSLSVVGAMGLALIVTYLTVNMPKKQEETDWAYLIMGAIVKWTFFLFLGWLFHLWL